MISRKPKFWGMNFDKDVIERSYSIPVVVDFWASWCGPCKVLGPVIEQLADEQEGRWELVKVDTEANQDLANRFGIRSIPNVKLFSKGDVVAEFAGALPRNQIAKWLDEHLPDERKEKLESLLEAIENGTDSLDSLRVFQIQYPDWPEARIALARQLVFSEPEEAANLVSPIRLGEKGSQEAEDIRLIQVFMEHQTDHSPAGLAMNKAQRAFSQGDLEGGILRVIEATQADKNYSQELPRKVAIAIFRLLGTDHPLTKEYRWRFDMALY